MTYTPEQIGEQVVVAAQSVQAANPGALGAAISILLQNDNWKSYIDPADKRPHDWQDFRQFVAERLETTVEALVGALAHTPALAAKVATLGTAERGRKAYVSDSDTYHVHPDSATGGMRRLQRERADLAAEVEAGRMTVNAAMIAAGFRKPRASVPLDTADNAIRALARHFPAHEIAEALERMMDTELANAC